MIAVKKVFKKILRKILIFKSIRIVKKAGKIIRNSFLASHNSLDFYTKVNNSDMVTKIDLDVEKYILKKIKKIFPGIVIYSEEKENNLFNDDLDSFLVLDPIDGTNNFFHGIPCFCISFFVKNKIINSLSIIYNPITRFIITCDGESKNVLLNGKNVISFHKSIPTKEFTNMTVAVVSNYNISPAITESIKLKIWNYGVGRILSTWSPSSDFLGLLSGDIDVIIVFCDEIFSQKAGVEIVKKSSYYSSFIFFIEKDTPINVFCHINNTKMVLGALKNIFC